MTASSLHLRVRWPFVAVALIVGSAAALQAVGLSLALVTYLVFVGALIQLSVVDLAEHRLPNELTLRAFLGAAVLLPFATASSLEGTSLSRALAGAAASFLFHLAIHLASPGSFGLGDVKLSPTIGAHLAFLSVDAFLWGLVSSFALNAIVAVGLMVSGRANRRTKIAFGPFMAAGACLAMALHGATA